MSMIRVQIPATCANLGPGLFSTALALGLHNTVDVSEREIGFKVRVLGDNFLSEEEEIVARILSSLESYFRYIERAPAGLDITVHQSIPANAGLGSERAVTLACLLGVNLLLGSPVSREDLVQMVVKPQTDASAHIAALYGGLISSTVADDRLIYRSLPIRVGRVGILLPHKPLRVEPISEDSDIPLMDVRAQARNMALSLYALATDDLELLAGTFHGASYESDIIPHLPGYHEAVAVARTYDDTAISISGMGPSLIVFSGDKLEDVVESVRSALRRALQCEISSWIVPVDTQGVTISEMGGSVAVRKPPMAVDEHRVHADQ